VRNKNLVFVWTGIASIVFILLLCNLLHGDAQVPAPQVVNILIGKGAEKAAWENIVLYSRFPQAITALLTGAALAVCGLMLQTLFRNPLAGPSILGVSNGADLGAAVAILYSGGVVGSGLSVLFAAFTGSMTVLMLIVYFSGKIRSNTLILIVGMMIGYLASSIVAILHSFASSENIRFYVLWGMGSFSNVTVQQLPLYSILIGFGLLGSILLIKPLNILLLGENYAFNMGIPVRRIRLLILLCTSLLTAIATAFCGPVSFIGLAVPHLARMILRTSNQRVLLPATLLFGSAVALLCNLATHISFGAGLLPLNAATSLTGAPIIIYVIMNKKNTSYFN
jgi:iron complex transport system permease protein